ncbi:hypothetical protein [Carnobacterium pleistocenium]|uniref:hypothetical protein n=1 Tax=Carnobacterium pleistocenium TaxID=181073 RepID=UPI000558F901|nr:hypothetical protein [Carnobacterium pleistocenium]
MKYQKIKKVTIDAIQIQSQNINEVMVFVGSEPLNAEEFDKFIDEIESKGIYVQALDGTKKASIGDYIVKTEEGYNVVKGTLFESMYEKVLE